MKNELDIPLLQFVNQITTEAIYQRDVIAELKELNDGLYYLGSVSGLKHTELKQHANQVRSDATRYIKLGVLYNQIESLHTIVKYEVISHNENGEELFSDRFLDIGSLPFDYENGHVYIGVDSETIDPDSVAVFGININDEEEFPRLQLQTHTVDFKNALMNDDQTIKFTFEPIKGDDNIEIVIDK